MAGKNNLRNDIRYRILEIRHIFKECLMACKLAARNKSLGMAEGDRNLVVAMVDGSSYHGGLCDRFKGIVSIYAFCKKKNLPFRIRYTHPFRLEDYLEPASYDWILKDGEFTENPRHVRILYMRGEYRARRLLGFSSGKQVHFYGNRDLLGILNSQLGELTEYDWGTLFRELFRPGQEMRRQLDMLHRQIGGNYCAVVFRFMNLLGDFKEYCYKSISDQSQRQALMDICLDSINDIMKRHPGRKILVTSDSVTFLEKASRIENVFIIPGTLVHIDGNREVLPGNSHDVFMKSFLDFYMLSEAEKIYSVKAQNMYRSQFPEYAAKVNNIPFERVGL